MNAQTKSLVEPAFGNSEYLQNKEIQSKIFWCKKCFLNNIDSKSNFLKIKLSKFSKLNTIYSVNKNDMYNQANKPNLALIQLANMNQAYDVTSINSMSIDNDNIFFYVENEKSEKSEIESNFMRLIVSSIIPSSTDISKSFYKNFEALLNQSISFKNLPNCIYSGSETIVFIKPDKTRKDFENDLNKIGISKDITILENGLKIAVHRSNDLKNSELRVNSNFSVISIKYGTEYDRINYMNFIKEKSEQLAWTRERQNVLELNEHSFKWNQTDISALSSLGVIPNISFKLIKDLNNEPSILCDPNNLKFFKETNPKRN
jgi:hypothetical protein